jgi:hypothetical protein
MSRTSCPLLALGLLATLAGGGRAEESAVQLIERFPAGYLYHVSTRVDLTGTLNLPPEKGKPAPAPLELKGTSAIEYDERVLEVGPDGAVRKTARICRRTDFERTVGGRPQQSSLRPEVRRLVLLRHQNKEVPFSPDGPLTWGEIDLVRTDVFTPALAGLLPARPVRLGERWLATEAAIRELTDLERIDEGKLECKLEQMVNVEKRRHARVAFSGAVRGANEDGPNRQELEGYFFFDLESNHLSYLFLRGRHVLLDKDSKEVGRIEGRFVLTRQAHTRCPELTDEAWRGVALEPNADNTLLLYDNPGLGLRLLYPRRWKVVGTQGNQLALDSADGNGLLVTVDPLAKVPTGQQFLAESREWLQKKARLLRVDPPRPVAGATNLEHFALEAEMGGQRFVMDYYVTRQASGGATLAARLLPNDLATLQREVERIARSVVITRK